MNIDQLPYLMAIATTGSLSAAAKQVGVTQQALSKYLAELESEAGLDLFFRHKRHYLPTPAGHLCIEAAQRILELRQHTVSALANPDHQQTGVLRLGVSPVRGIDLMVQVYPPFDRRYPRMRLEVTEGYGNELRNQLLQNRLDAVLYGHIGEVPPGCQLIFIDSDEMVLAVPSFHPLVRHHTARLDELPFASLRSFRDSLFIQPRPSSNMYEMAQSLFDQERFHPQITVSLPNIKLQLAMVRGGTHVALIPSYFVQPDPDIAYFRLHNSPRMYLVYMTRSGHTLSEAERYLIWLITASKIRDPNTHILWSDALREIRDEFGTADAGGLL